MKHKKCGGKFILIHKETIKIIRKCNRCENQIIKYRKKNRNE